MDNNIIQLIDENGNKVLGQVLNIIEIDGVEYLLYSVGNDEEDNELYAKKIIKDDNGEDDLMDIVDEDEKNKVFDIVREYINSIEE